MHRTRGKVVNLQLICLATVFPTLYITMAAKFGSQLNLFYFYIVKCKTSTILQVDGTQKDCIFMSNHIYSFDPIDYPVSKTRLEWQFYKTIIEQYPLIPVWDTKVLTPQSMAMIKKPTETYIRKTGYRAKAFLLGLTAALMNGYAAHELHANAMATTTILMMTLSLRKQISAPTSRGNRQ